MMKDTAADELARILKKCRATELRDFPATTTTDA
jgi:hypothetical protein